MPTPSTIRTVFNAIELLPIISINWVKSIDHGIATRTTKMPDKLSVAIVANIKIKARIEMAI